MQITYSVFPKMMRELTIPELADLLHSTGFKACNAVIREGYWTEPKNMKQTLAPFVKQMGELGINVFIATTGWNPEDINENPDVLSIMKTAGITEVRVTQLHSGKGYGQVGEVRAELEKARLIFERCAKHSEKAGIRCVYQTHHRTLLPSASSLYPLLKGLNPKYFAGMLDGGNQPIEGFEDWVRSAKLMGEYLAGFGIKDAKPTQNPDKAAEPDKGWSWGMVPCQEGVTDWGRVKEALQAVDFNGFFIFMPFYHKDDIKGKFKVTLKQEVTFIRNIFNK